MYVYNGNENENKNSQHNENNKHKNNHRYNDRSMWTKIACAFAPSALRENYLLDPTQTLREEAHLVRVGDADLDIALAVPADVWKETRLTETSRASKSIVTPTLQQQRSGRPSRQNQHTVTIRIDFPEGSSFDKYAFTFEDELSAVIRQVRLLERNANDRLSSLQTAN